MLESRSLQLKSVLKRYLLDRMHAQPEIVGRVATRVVRDGVARAVVWAFEDERAKTLQYVESLRTEGRQYRFSRSGSGVCLYSSIYACMIEGLFGLHEAKPTAREEWVDFFDSHQDPVDGYFRDAALGGDEFENRGSWGDGWGKTHLAAHIIIAYAQLGGTPRLPFKFLEPFYEDGHVDNWLASFNFNQDVWGQSNYIMNVCTLLQYTRDHLSDARASRPVEKILLWLAARQRADTGMWHEYNDVGGYPRIGDAIRGAYHFYPLFVYEGIDINHKEAIIDTILRSQNSWGGFNPENLPSGACEDIDAIDPLLRCSMGTPYRRDEVIIAVQRARVWLLSCRNSDGGYESIPENECPYGGHPATTSRPGEGNLFATWFRTLCLAYVTEFLDVPNGFVVGHYPGYEIRLKA